MNKLASLKENSVEINNHSTMRKRTTIAFYIVLSILFCMLLFKSRYGIGNMDESFYLTIPYRMTQGDSLFLHEWHLSQMSGLLLYPFVKVFLMINGSTVGIILAFRYIYLVVQLIATIIIFNLYKRYSIVGSAIGSLLFFIFVPFGIMALSYNSMGVICFSLSLAFLVCSEKKLLTLLSGVMFSCAVLCCPFLAVLYLIYILTTLFFYIYKNKNSIANTQRLLFFTLGILMMLLLFLVYLFKNLSIDQLKLVIPQIINDQEHSLNVTIKIKTLINNIFMSTKLTPIVMVLYVVTTIFGCITKDANKKNICFIICILNTALFLIIIIEVLGNINMLMFPMFCCAINIFIIYHNKELNKLFYGVCIPTIVYCVCIYFSSDTRLNALSIASSVSICSNIIIVVETLKRNVNINSKQICNKLSMISLILLIIIQFGSQLFYRMNKVFWEDSMKDQIVEMKDGIDKGILVSEQKFNEWSNYTDDINSSINNKKVLFFSRKTWLYLINDNNNCSYSSWFIGTPKITIEKLLSYYKINPDKLPDIIYVENEFNNDVSELINKLDYKYKENSNLGNYIYVKN